MMSLLFVLASADDGVQHEYLMQIIDRSWTHEAQANVLDDLLEVLSHPLWDGATLRGE